MMQMGDSVAGGGDSEDGPGARAREARGGGCQRLARLLVDGLVEVEIAERLGLAPSTIHSHISSIRRRLRIEGRTRGALRATM